MRNRREAMGEMLPADFAGVTRELEDARRLIWPGHREEHWRAFQQREAFHSGVGRSREPLLSIE